MNPEKHLQNQVDYMLSHGIVEPSNSSWSSSCLLAIKSDRSVSVQTIRKSTISQSQIVILFLTWKTVDHVDSVAFVTKLDLLKGDWQVPLTLRAGEMSAFVTPDSFLQYTVVPFWSL